MSTKTIFKMLIVTAISALVFIWSMLLIPNESSVIKATERWELGTISSTNGALVQDPSRIRMTVPVRYLKGQQLILTDPAYKFALIFYDDEGTFIRGTGMLPDNTYTMTSDSNSIVIIAKKDHSDLTNLQAEVIHKLEVLTPEQGFPGKLKFKFTLDPSLTELQSHTMVGDELWTFPPSNDTNTDFKTVLRYKIDFENNSQVLVGSFSMNWGHVNSISYNRITDSLILGNGSSDYSLPGKIIIFENASSFKNETKVDISKALTIDVSDQNWGAKTNVVWGEENNGQANIAYVITNDNRNIRKIRLGQGSDILSKGSFVEAKSALEYNGTYEVLNVYSQTNGDDVNQGTSYHEGNLYIGLGHNNLWYSINKLNNDGTITKESVKVSSHTWDDILTPKITEGISLIDNYIIIGTISNNRENEIYIFEK